MFQNKISYLHPSVSNKQNKIYEVNTNEGLNKRYFVDNKEDVVLEKENIKLKENMLLKIKDGKVEEVVYDSDIQTRLK